MVSYKYCFCSSHFKSSLFSASNMVSPALLKLLIFLPLMYTIPCPNVFHIYSVYTYSAYSWKRYGDVTQNVPSCNHYFSCSEGGQLKLTCHSTCPRRQDFLHQLFISVGMHLVSGTTLASSLVPASIPSPLLSQLTATGSSLFFSL